MIFVKKINLFKFMTDEADCVKSRARSNEAMRPMCRAVVSDSNSRTFFRNAFDASRWVRCEKWCESLHRDPGLHLLCAKPKCQSLLLADIVEKAVKYSPDGESSPCFGDGSEGLFGRRLGRHPGRYAASITGSIFIDLSRASRLRFWAVAARRNSSLAPFGPLNRRRVSSCYPAA
jgi:hypothetical protein